MSTLRLPGLSLRYAFSNGVTTHWLIMSRATARRLTHDWEKAQDTTEFTVPSPWQSGGLIEWDGHQCEVRVDDIAGDKVYTMLIPALEEVDSGLMI